MELRGALKFATALRSGKFGGDDRPRHMSDKDVASRECMFSRKSRIQLLPAKETAGEQGSLVASPYMNFAFAMA